MPDVQEAIVWYHGRFVQHDTWFSKTAAYFWRAIKAARRWKQLGGDPKGYSLDTAGGLGSSGAVGDGTSTGGPGRQAVQVRVRPVDLVSSCLSPIPTVVA